MREMDDRGKKNRRWKERKTKERKKERKKDGGERIKGSWVFKNPRHQFC